MIDFNVSMLKVIAASSHATHVISIHQGLYFTHIRKNG